MQNQAIVDIFCDKLLVDAMNFSDWLRKELSTSDLSNAELARRINKSATYIGHLVRNFSPNTKNGQVRYVNLDVERTQSIAERLDRYQAEQDAKEAEKAKKAKEAGQEK